jgi:nucleolar complex protein 2
LLQQLAASTESFIPTTFLLLGVLDSKEIRSKPLRDDVKGKQKSKTAVRGIRLPLILKLPKEGTLRTVEQLDAVLKETFLLLNREIDLYRYSPAFPEFTFVILQRLRKVSAMIMIVAWCQDLFAH